MPVAQTSLQAYASIKNLGLNQRIVLAAIKQHPLSSNEDIAAVLGWTINRVTPRTNELRAAGLVRIGGTKRSRVTGMKVQWMEAA